MKRKTSQKALSSQTLSTRLEAWKRSDLSQLALTFLSCFLGKTFSVACACSLIVLCSLLSLSLVFIIFDFFLVTWLNS